MKRKFLAFLLAFVMVVGMLPMAALAVEGDTGTNTLQAQITAATDNTETTISVADDATESITIPSNKKIILNIANGKTLTNTTDQDTITVEAGGTLNVSGEGIVDNVSHQKAALMNDGTVTLSGCTFSRSNEAGTSTTQSGGNSWYTIKNRGKMTINTDTTVQPKVAEDGTVTGAYSSLIQNVGANDATEGVATLIINGGSFNGGVNTVKNDGNGNLTIIGGTFTNTTQYAILNWNVATITGGEFTCKQSGVVCSAKNTANQVSIGKLTISGGEFHGAADKAAVLTPTSPYNSDSITITGGTFSSDPSAYVPATHKATEDSTAGTWTVAEKEPVTAPAVTFSIPESVTLGSDPTTLVSEPVATLTPSTKNVIKVPELTANYITGWTDFNGSDVSEQNGNYLPMKITLAGEAAKDSIAKVEVIGSKTKTWTNDGTNFNFFTEDGGKSETLIMQLNKLVGNAGEEETGPADGHFRIIITPKATEEDITQAATYDIDCTGVTLKLPEAPKGEVDKTTGESKIEFTTEADKKQEAANVTNIINAVKAPNKTDDSAEGVETTHDTAIITYDVTTAGTADSATGTVTLPSDVAKALQQDGETDKVDVKVDIVTDAATVTLSTEAIGKLSKDNDTAIKAEPKTQSDVNSNTSITDTNSAALVEHVGNGVDVTVKANSTDLITSSSPLPDEGALEITMKVSVTSGNVHILYLNESNVFELIGTYPVDANGYVTFKVKHLCQFYEVASNSTTDPLVENLTKSDNTPKNVELTIGTTGAFRTATVKNLAANGKCTVQVCREANAAPAVILVLTADGNGDATFQVNAGSEVSVWKGVVTFEANGAPSDSTLEHVTKTA